MGILEEECTDPKGKRSLVESGSAGNEIETVEMQQIFNSGSQTPPAQEVHNVDEALLLNVEGRAGS